jgi:hypothetical protein
VQILFMLRRWRCRHLDTPGADIHCIGIVLRVVMRIPILVRRIVRFLAIRAPSEESAVLRAIKASHFENIGLGRKKRTHRRNTSPIGDSIGPILNFPMARRGRLTASRFWSLCRVKKDSRCQSCSVRGLMDLIVKEKRWMGSAW